MQDALPNMPAALFFGLPNIWGAGRATFKTTMEIDIGMMVPQV